MNGINLFLRPQRWGVGPGVWLLPYNLGVTTTLSRTRSHCLLPQRRVSKQHRVRRDDTATRTSGEGLLVCGPCGAGNFVKMVHNGI